MTRILLTTSIMLGTFIASGPGATADNLPVPPIPPEHPLLAEVAPVPNLDARVPVTAASDSPTFDVRLYRARPYDPGMGFAPGSRYQTSEDRKPIQTPGVSISVPLE